MTVPAIAFTAPVGPEGAPLLVLGPSLGTSTILWDDVAPALAQDHRVVRFDLPGHGDAPSPPEPFTVGDIADAVAEAVAGIAAGGEVRYAGVSLGGAVGLELLLRHPGLVASVAIICSGAKIGTSEGWLGRAAKVRAESTSALVIPSAQRWFAPGSIEAHPVLAGRLLHALQDADDEGYARCCEALAAYDVRDRLGEIGAPVLAVWGAHDDVTPESDLALIAAGVRDGRAAGLPDAGHLAPVDDPEGLVGLLRDFFAGRR